MEITDKLMFLRYAAPCVEDFVLQGLMSKEYSNQIMCATKKGEVIENSENQFDLAHIMCEITAKKMNYQTIDKRVIRTYYLNLHNKLIGIHKPIACSEEDCKIKIVKEINENQTCFFSNISGDNLVIHRNYVVDILTNTELEEILSKSSYLATH